MEMSLGVAPEDWRAQVAELVTTSKPSHAAALPGALLRFHMGRVMPSLRGKVPAMDVRTLISGILSAAEEVR